MATRLSTSSYHGDPWRSKGAFSFSSVCPSAPVFRPAVPFSLPPSYSLALPRLPTLTLLPPASLPPSFARHTPFFPPSLSAVIISPLLLLLTSATNTLFSHGVRRVSPFLQPPPFLPTLHTHTHTLSLSHVGASCTAREARHPGQNRPRRRRGLSTSPRPRRPPPLRLALSHSAASVRRPLLPSPSLLPVPLPFPLQVNTPPSLLFQFFPLSLCLLLPGIPSAARHRLGCIQVANPS